MFVHINPFGFQFAYIGFQYDSFTVCPMADLFQEAVDRRVLFSHDYLHKRLLKCLPQKNRH
nr:MAG TPA: hypothetical protein [Bacteriophage sp.]